MTLLVKVSTPNAPMPDYVEMDGTAAFLVVKLVQSLLRSLPEECAARENLTPPPAPGE